MIPVAHSLIYSRVDFEKKSIISSEDMVVIDKVYKISCIECSSPHHLLHTSKIEMKPMKMK